ncbi:hypothetical protein JRC04_18730 [Mycolicibacterium sp. S2-37]|uniref:hypothetical protein n=1 Tax=Mycolicibacterium sp. S2-37 TaxID=2810297 RepID=UPI001A94E677|nr:hypothetical protein [Mycolicibacterium sp. S2-37]MBO0679502.1 hypothetical protein [Mycolicibacterium sp. S2-37]
MRKLIAVLGTTWVVALGGAGIAQAHTAAGTPVQVSTITVAQNEQVDSGDNGDSGGDSTGLWGLAGLLGLLGLLGLKPRKTVPARGVAGPAVGTAPQS